MNIALILAGGSGTRVCGEKPKQFMEINGKPMLVHTVCRFMGHPQIDYICVITAEEYLEYTKELLSKYGCKVDAVLPGGCNRRESSLIGILYLKSVFSPENIVLIHDGARPNVSLNIISENIKKATETGAAVTAVRSQDTILLGNCNDMINGYVDRDNAYTVQTPQSFRLGVISKAHFTIDEKIRDGLIDDSKITDDSMLAYMTGEKVSIVQGEKQNIKVTTMDDFGIICNIMK
ncbi:MAG: 2-C-methyl-D-erythritol 4-phosphate cytidylyltransferase [Clostridia bacterium]|nr:2-C-methyl-D-erythritol 4-phosphate cytidylyltransferase [Clostridia bacterium]